MSRREEHVTMKFLVGLNKVEMEASPEFVDQCSAQDNFDSEEVVNRKLTMELPGDQEAIVKTMLQWPQRKNLLLEYDASEADVFHFIKLWIMAEKSGLMPMQKKIERLLLHYINIHPRCILGRERYSYVYANTSPSSLIRECLVKWFVWRLNIEEFLGEETQAWARRTPDLSSDLLFAYAYKTSIFREQPYRLLLRSSWIFDPPFSLTKTRSLRSFDKNDEWDPLLDEV